MARAGKDLYVYYREFAKVVVHFQKCSDWVICIRPNKRPTKFS